MTVKELALLHRRAGLTRAAFDAAWRNAGPLPASAGAVRQLCNLAATSQEPGTIGAAADYDAVVETWLDAAAAPGPALPRLRPELAALADPAGSLTVRVREVALRAPAGGRYSVLSLLHRPAGTSQEAFSRHWAEVHGPLLVAVDEFWRYCRGYVQNHVAPGSARTLAGGAVSGMFDGMTQLWFDSDAMARQGYRVPGYLRDVKPDEANIRGGPPLRMLADEVALHPAG